MIKYDFIEIQRIYYLSSTLLTYRYFSSRPHTAVQDDLSNDEHLSSMSPQKMMTLSPVSAKDAILKARNERDDDRNGIASLVYHTTDFVVTPIIENTKARELCLELFSTLCFFLISKNCCDHSCKKPLIPA